jgi:hypothetical protein
MKDLNAVKSSVQHNFFTRVFLILNAHLIAKTSIVIIMLFNLEIFTLLMFGFSLSLVKNEKGKAPFFVLFCFVLINN